MKDTIEVIFGWLVVAAIIFLIVFQSHLPGPEPEQRELIVDEPEAELYQDKTVMWDRVTEDMDGQTVSIQGTVAEVSQPQTNGNPTFIDIGEAYPSENRVSVVIWEEDISKFDDVFALRGKEIVVNGTLHKYDGVFDIEISYPDQIEVLQ